VAAGAWHVLGGFLFLLRHARLWPIAALPALLGVLLIFVGGALGMLSLISVEHAVAPHYVRLPAGWSLAVMLALWTTTIAVGIVAGLTLALLLSAPLLDHLSRRTEDLLLRRRPDPLRLAPLSIAQSFRSALVLAAMLPLAFGLGILPLLGPPLLFTWTAYALACQQSEAPLLHRGLDAAGRRLWQRDWRWECLGFGAAGLIALVVPVVNFLIVPALAVGMARLVVEVDALRREREGRPGAFARETR
jgi:CysZ protein